jgi:hypothetical protein
MFALVECEHGGKCDWISRFVEESNLGDQAIPKPVDRDLAPARADASALGRPADSHSRVLVEIQEVDRLELERAFRDVDKFLQERHYLVAPTKAPGMALCSS